MLALPRPPGARAASRKLKSGKLKITKTRTSTSVAIKVTKLKPGTLQFAVKALRLSAPTTVTLDIRRS